MKKHTTSEHIRKLAEKVMNGQITPNKTDMQLLANAIIHQTKYKK